MLEWSVEYCNTPGAPLATIQHTSGPWTSLPRTGVVRVYLVHGPYRHTLSGMDYYWMDEETTFYGMFNDPKNADWYEGRQAVAWVWPTPDSHASVANPNPPLGVHTLEGIMLPDSYARNIGLLGPNDSSPPRPG